MSSTKHSRRIVLLVGGLALTAAGSAMAGPQDKVCQNPILGVIEGPDPITGRCAWESATATGMRVRARDPRSGRRVEVWAAPAGADHDIALEEWLGAERSRVTYLTSALTDDLDPRAAFDRDGTLHVVWWSRGERDEVVYARREARSGGWSPDRVVAAGARRPALAVVDDAAWIAFERDSTSGVEIVLGEPDSTGEIVVSVAARVVGPSVAGLALSVEAGRPRIEWTEADGRVVRVERWGSAWVRHDVGVPVR